MDSSRALIPAEALSWAKISPLREFHLVVLLLVNINLQSLIQVLRSKEDKQLKRHWGKTPLLLHLSQLQSTHLSSVLYFSICTFKCCLTWLLVLRFPVLKLFLRILNPFVLPVGKKMEIYDIFRFHRIQKSIFWHNTPLSQCSPLIPLSVEPLFPLRFQMPVCLEAQLQKVR